MGLDVIMDDMLSDKRRIAQLEAALQPFAKIADEIEATASAAACDASHVVGPARWEDCKRAREALSR